MIPSTPEVLLGVASAGRGGGGVGWGFSGTCLSHDTGWPEECPLRVLERRQVYCPWDEAAAGSSSVSSPLLVLDTHRSPSPRQTGSPATSSQKPTGVSLAPGILRDRSQGPGLLGSGPLLGWLPTGWSILKGRILEGGVAGPDAAGEQLRASQPPGILGANRPVRRFPGQTFVSSARTTTGFPLTRGSVTLRLCGPAQVWVLHRLELPSAPIDRE